MKCIKEHAGEILLRKGKWQSFEVNDQHVLFCVAGSEKAGNKLQCICIFSIFKREMEIS